MNRFYNNDFTKIVIQSLMVLEKSEKLMILIGKKAYTHLGDYYVSQSIQCFLYYNKGEKTYKYLEDKLIKVRF
jgi:hypothetical protein